jgi:hypothetical protein
MSKASFYIKMEVSEKFTEKEIDDLVSSISRHIENDQRTNMTPDKPIKVKKVVCVSSADK